jgi:hypothetical protein
LLQFSILQSLGSCLIFGGDFNSKHTLWGSKLITPKGRELATLIQTKNHSVLSTGTPTYWTTDTRKTPDLLDFFIISGFSPSYADIQHSYDLSSDYTPIISTPSTIFMTKRPIPRLHNSRTDWHRYKSEISNQVKCKWKLKTREDIDAAVTKFTKILKQAAHLATPATKIHGTTTYLPSKIKCLDALKRKARATWQKTHAPEDRRILNNATNKLRTALHNQRNENFTTFVSSLSNSDHSIW